MALLAGLTLLMMCVVPSRAEFTLNSQHDVTGTWRRPVVLPCSYMPHNFAQRTVVWMHDGKRIFESDSTGDHTFMTKYRGRLSLPQDRQEGDVSITIGDLQTDDKGTYTCQVSMIPDGATSRITKEADIYLTVQKVSVTKPVIQPGDSFLVVPEQAAVNLTCSAFGSLPITYKWYKHESGSGVKVFQSEGASFVIGKADPSHAGVYFCEAENRIPERKVQQSHELRLSVTADAVQQILTTTNIPKIIISTTASGSIGKLQTREHSSTTARKTTAIHKPATSTAAEGVRQPLRSSSVPKKITSTTETDGNVGKAQTTQLSRTTAKKTPGIPTPSTTTAVLGSRGLECATCPLMKDSSESKADEEKRNNSSTSRASMVLQGQLIKQKTKDNVPRPAHHPTKNPRVISGSAESPGKVGTPQPTRISSTAAGATATFTADLHHSSGTPSWLIILVILLSLALICTLIALLVTRSKKRKGTDGTYEIPIMSQLDGRANQNAPAATIYRVATCQANGSQAHAPWTNDTAAARKENRYEPAMDREAEPHSDYQNAPPAHESEYEELLVERERAQ